MIQTIIVWAILAATLFFTVRWIYLSLTKKESKCHCSCSSCPMSGKGDCHCHDSKPDLPEIKV